MKKLALWLTPPFLGVLSFLAASPGGVMGKGISDGGRAISTNPGTGALRVRDSSNESLADFIAAFNHATEEQLTRGRARLQAASAEEIRASILKRLAKLKAYETLPGSEPFSVDEREALAAEVKQLGRLDREMALNWILENRPDLKIAVMDGWAEIDPTGAFRKVATSNTLEPCSKTTLISLLDQVADGDPQALKKACDSVKWELFQCGSDSDPFNPGFTLPPGASIRPWLDSGSAVALKQDGVFISNFVSRWAAEFPDEALAQWNAGAGMAAGDSAEILTEILEHDPGEAEATQKLAAAIDRLSPEQRERFSQVATETADSRGFRDDWEKSYPGLLKPAAATGSGQ